MEQSLTILGVAGSLRQGSYNRAALRAARDLAPAGVRVDIFELGGFPEFSEDNEGQPMAKVTEFKSRIRAADGVLIVTPEYNYSVPGVLKNAIDWASRPYGDNAWTGKPAGIMGASVGMLGAARAQYHLRQICVFLDMHLMNGPEVMIPTADEKFDEQGNLTDMRTRERIRKFMAALAEWVRRLT